MQFNVSSTCRISSVVSVSVALAEPSASKGSSPLVMRHCRAGASPEQVHVRLSVVNTGTATVSTGMFGLYLATRRAVEPPLVRTTIKDACTYSSNSSCMHCIQSDATRSKGKTEKLSPQYP